MNVDMVGSTRRLGTRIIAPLLAIYFLPLADSLGIFDQPRLWIVASLTSLVLGLSSGWGSDGVPAEQKRNRNTARLLFLVLTTLSVVEWERSGYPSLVGAFGGKEFAGFLTLGFGVVLAGAPRRILPGIPVTDRQSLGVVVGALGHALTLSSPVSLALATVVSIGWLATQMRS